LHARTLFTARRGGNRVFVCVAMASLAAIFGAPLRCQAQETQVSQKTLDSETDFHSKTVAIAGGTAYVAGTDGKSLVWGPFLRAGAGFSVWHTPSPEFENGKLRPARRRTSLFIVGNFMFDRSGIKASAIQQAILMNPQNTALLGATSGKAKFYSATLDLMLRRQLSGSVGAYWLAGFGWLQRSLAFNGVSLQGGLIQPTYPAVFGPSGNSGVFDAAGGVDWKVCGKGEGLRAFVEVRLLRGLAINSGTTLVPLSAGLRW
jgi:hypothetical protein